ncbi:non-structural maintenance of chromosomes element 3 homolog [Crassostrea angulata]|uniref:non-structural maintenance of chromosomes element 3 homolog n=1 Tax=Magallana angulata TaxID=2784310 RepID=UPI0022B180E3|nr:non-structural maintenance of chromosomes element 3 homolog [Crassostrea angulata]
MPRTNKQPDNDRIPSSQVAATQAEKAHSSMDRGEQEKKLHDLVQFLLIMDQKKLPIKKLDINKQVLKEHSKALPVMMKLAEEKLRKIFGIELVSLEDKQKGTYILVNTLDTDVDEQLESDPNLTLTPVDWSDENHAKTGLLMVVLSAIFMNGEVMVDSQLYHMLRKLKVDQDVTHPVFGDVKKQLTVEFVRQGYLEYTRQPNTDPPVFEFRWGFRAKKEITKRNCLDFVSQLYEKNPEEWVSQYQVVVEEEGEEEEGSSAS